jgi:hypothetical protein
MPAKRDLEDLAIVTIFSTVVGLLFGWVYGSPGVGAATGLGFGLWLGLMALAMSGGQR